MFILIISEPVIPKWEITRLNSIATGRAGGVAEAGVGRAGALASRVVGAGRVQMGRRVWG